VRLQIKKLRAAVADEEGHRRPQRDDESIHASDAVPLRVVHSMSAVLGNPLRQTVLGLQFFLFHARQANIIQWQHAQLRVEHLFVELFVPVVEPTKLDIAVHEYFDIGGGLTFEHR
jgi:hypothetical protein